MASLTTHIYFSSILRKEFPVGQNSGKKDIAYLIGTGRPTEMVIEAIKELSSKGLLQEELKKRYTDYKVTALHIAVMRGEQTICNAILEQNPPLDMTDDNGCTALHLAAMTENALLLQVMIAAADKVNTTIRGMRNNMRATAEEILATLSPPRYPNDTIVAYAKTASQEVQPLTAEQFHKIAGFHYCPYVISKPELHVENWRMTAYIPDWSSMTIPQPTPLYLEEERLGNISLGWGVRARQFIKAFEIIDVYGGVDELQADSLYSMCGVNAQLYGTLSSRMNDGDPNCAALGQVQNGIMSSFMLTTHPIAEGEPVRINYKHNHPCKWELYAFSPRTDFLSFVKSGLNFFAELRKFDRLEQLHGRKPLSSYPPEYLESFALNNRITYIFETPAVLTQLLLKENLNFFTCEQVLRYLITNRKERNNNKEFKIFMHYIKAVIQLMESAREHSGSNNMKAIADYFCRLLDEHRVILVLQEIKQLIVSGDLENWPACQKRLEKRLGLKNKVLSLASDLMELSTILNTNKGFYQSLLEEPNLIEDIAEASWLCFSEQTNEKFSSFLTMMFP